MSFTDSGKNQLFTPTYTASTTVDGYIYFAFANNENWNGNVYFYNGSGFVGTAWPGKSIHSYSNTGGSPTGSKAYKIDIPSGATHAIFTYSNNLNGNHYYRTKPVTLSSIATGNGIYGKIDKETNSNYDEYDIYGVDKRNDYVEYTPTGETYNTNSVNNITEGSFSDYTVMTGGGTTNYSASYQVEDRYGYISDVNGSADINNCITINTTISNPYIIFYPNAGGTGTAIGNSTAANGGMQMAALDRDGNTGNTSYIIRLPKNAKSFKIASGPDGTPGSAFNLSSSSIQVNASDGQLYDELEGGDMVTLVRC